MVSIEVEEKSIAQAIENTAEQVNGLVKRRKMRSKNHWILYFEQIARRVARGISDKEF